MISTTKLSLQKCECCQYLIGAIKDKFNDPVNSDKGILMSQLLKSSSKPDFQNSLDETHLLNRTYKLEDITRPMLLHPKPNDTINPVHSGPWKVYDGEPLLQIGLLPGQCITDLHESVMGPSQTVSDNVTDVCFQDDLSMSTDISTRTESVATGLASFTQNDWNCLETMINSC
uniref:Uncharacterized protein LOC100183975 n=1 Tax=Phallusia mammillata TaxID=59560 RepID=A0A6F9DIP8_9ASCI|nr:uncharacterized protein LOC100183975 [Phallusia mammillata]